MRTALKVGAAFAIGLAVASGATLAQSYGRGRNVQFVDGATISPTNVTASGAADQFVCTATNAVCEVESSIDAATMTSTVPAFDIGPTATPGTNDKLACFSYGPSGSKTRTACVDAEGDINARVFQSTALAAGTGFACTNVGCRLSLGNTGRYLVDDGTNLEFVAPLQATTFEATTASGSSLTGGGASGPLLITSNTPDSFTDQGSSGAFLFKANESLAGGDMILRVVNNTNVEKFAVTNAGFAVASQVGTNANSTFVLFSAKTDAADAVGHIVQANLLATEGSKIMNWRRYTTSFQDVAWVDHLGLFRVNGANAAKPTCNATNRGKAYFLNGATGVADTYEICAKNTADAYAWVQSSLASDNTSASMELLSNTPDAVTSGTVPAIGLKASQNITDTDLLMSVEDSAGNRRLAIAENGNTSFTGGVTASGVIGTSFVATAGYFRREPASITIADSGGAGAAAYTWTPSFGASLTFFTCNDADGCDITMSETSTATGVHNRAVNVSANNITFTDTAGLNEMAGNFTAGQYDTIEFMYISDRYVELDRSNN